MSRIIDTTTLIPIIEQMVIDACYNLPTDVINALTQARNSELSPYGKNILSQLLENADLARKEALPACQDTGTAIVYLQIGQEISWTGMALEEAVNQGVRQGYQKGYLRKSIVKDPLRRINTEDNTPCLLHTEIVPGRRLQIHFMPKGGGSENVGAYTNLNPAAGEQKILDFVINTVKGAGGKPCPPIILGIGLGGTMDTCTWLAKKALLRPLGEAHPDPFYAALEQRLLKAINNLGIGPLGNGGTNTALAVHLDYLPTHITSLPVAVNFQCHSARHTTTIL